MIRILATAIAVLFGIATLFAGGRVLLGSDPGYVVFRPLLVYNVLMGLAYVAAGIIFWRSARGPERGGRDLPAQPGGAAGDPGAVPHRRRRGGGQPARDDPAHGGVAAAVRGHVLGGTVTRGTHVRLKHAAARPARAHCGLPDLPLRRPLA